MVASLAGFAGAHRPQQPGGCTAIPAALKYAPAASGRAPYSPPSAATSAQPSKCYDLLFLCFAQDIPDGNRAYVVSRRCSMSRACYRWPVFRWHHWPVSATAEGQSGTTSCRYSPRSLNFFKRLSGFLRPRWQLVRRVGPRGCRGRTFGSSRNDEGTKQTPALTEKLT
jgi:hypothetical protein